MSVKTKFFISSSAQDALSQLRNRMYDTLLELGHEPMLFERNFGAWDNHTDSVRKCIECVNLSDVFILFISNKAGTFYTESQRTVTHMEFIEAFNKGKTILVFVESTIKAEYFNKAKGIIDEYIEAHVKDSSTYPNASDIVTALRSMELSSHVDPYIWYFIYEIQKKGIYFESMDLGVSINWKEYFSDLLRRGLALLPSKDAIEINERQLERYDLFYDVLTNAINHVHLSGFQNPTAFLEAFRIAVMGDLVEQDHLYTKDTVGSFGNCSAVTLYAFQNGRMELIGEIGSPKAEKYYDLDNKNSFVALTFNQHDNQVFFKEESQTFYFCLRLPNHVMTFHLPCESQWNTDNFMAFKDSVIRVIIDKNAFVFELAIMLIGGMRHDN